MTPTRFAARFLYGPTQILLEWVNRSPGRIRTYNPSVTLIHAFLRGVDYLITDPC